MKKIYFILILIYCNVVVLFAQNIDKGEAEEIKENAKYSVLEVAGYLNRIRGVKKYILDGELNTIKKNIRDLFVSENVKIQRDFRLNATSQIVNVDDDLTTYIDNIYTLFRVWETKYEILEVSEISQNIENNSLFVCVTFDRVLKGSYIGKDSLEIVNSDRVRKLDAFVEIKEKNGGGRQLKISGISFHDSNRKFNKIEITGSEKQRETITILYPYYATNAEVGEKISILWKSNAKGNIRKIELLKNGVPVEYIRHSDSVRIRYDTSNRVYYQWFISCKKAGTYQVRLTTKNGLSVTSDKFLIKPESKPKHEGTYPLVAALVSIPLPGYGDKLNRNDKKRAGWWLESALVYGLIGGSIYLNNQSQDYYKQYNAVLEPEQRNTLFDKANLYNKISITSQWTGLAYWGLDIYLAYKTAKKAKMKNQSQNYSSFAPILQKPKPFWSANMQPSGFSLVYSF